MRKYRPLDVMLSLGLAAAILAIALMLVCSDDAKADNFSSSWKRTEDLVWFGTYLACDSARAYFGYPTISNAYESVKLLPLSTTDSFTLSGTGLDLDSTGRHVERVWFWGAGSTDSHYVDGYLYHYPLYAESPGTLPAGGHLCNVWGFFWDLQETAKPHVLLTFTLPEQATNTCDDVIMAYGPIQIETDDTGYFSVPLIQTECLLNPETGSPTEWMVEATWADKHGHGRSKTTTFAIPTDSTTYKLVF